MHHLSECSLSHYQRLKSSLALTACFYYFGPANTHSIPYINCTDDICIVTQMTPALLKDFTTGEDEDAQGPCVTANNRPYTKRENAPPTYRTKIQHCLKCLSHVLGESNNCSMMDSCIRYILSELNKKPDQGGVILSLYRVENRGIKHQTCIHWAHFCRGLLHRDSLYIQCVKCGKYHFTISLKM